MTLRLTVQEDAGSTQVIVRLPGVSDAVEVGGPQPFVSPLTISDFEDLRFYLEDYAQLPVGEYAVRGERVERERLSAWGEALHASIFGGDAKRGAAYLRARQEAEQSKPVEVAIQSNSPHFLALPWELMRAPGNGEPISVRVASFDRSLPVSDPPRHFSSTVDGFRVLMVIARPGGLDDVPFQAVARPLFQHLERNKSAVQIEVLRPPSFEELLQRLDAANAAGQPYHAVHFDGHGSFDDLLDGLGHQGFLLFEGENGYPQPVNAQKFAAALRAGDVPLVILNACQSGKIETADDAVGPEASVATRLLQDGAASVVAMSHSVYVVAAAAFIAAFYEELFAGRTVSEAVNEGRKALRLEKNRLRPSLKGDIPLQDWIVPVHYARSVLRLPQGETKPAQLCAAEEIEVEVHSLAHTDKQRMKADLAAADGVFFGRDAEFFMLERALRTHRMAVIHGVGGTGKTEVAKAFARWLQMSGGLDEPPLVFFYPFEPGLATFGLGGFINKIMSDIGEVHAYLAAGTTRERAELALTLFRQRRCLLIWDNFETVFSMPEPGQATPPLDETKKAELSWFIGELRNSKSALLITSRSKEPWLGGPEVFARCEVGGLGERKKDGSRDEQVHPDVLAYADHLLAPTKATAWRHDPAPSRVARETQSFKDLLDYLGGHPLSLKLILPRLSQESPSALLSGLRGQEELPAGFDAGGGRLQSLGASIYYSFRHLPEADQRCLVILSLFEKVVSANILGLMKNAPARFQGLPMEAWDTLLGRLLDLGLLTSLGGFLYRLHPALPPYLCALWQSRTAAAKDGGAEREAVLRSLIGAAATFADYLREQIGAGESQAALVQIASLRSNFGAFLAAALERKLFAEAQYLIQALDAYWEVAGLTCEAAAWVDRIVKATEPHPGQAPEIETDAHYLWLYASGGEANSAQRARDLPKAEELWRRIAVIVEGRNSEKAIAYHQLGVVAQDRGRLDEAEGWYKKSLAFEEALCNRPGIAGSYQQLGLLARARSRRDEAEGWYKKSLAIFEELGDQPHAAGSYGELGMLAQERGRLDEAEGWHKKSLAIFEALGDQPNAAQSYGALGLLAQQRGRLDEAEGWHKKSLAIFEALGDQSRTARSYGTLGLLARERGRLDEAEGWHKKSLAIFEALGDQSRMAGGYRQLGTVAQHRGRLDEAKSWYKKSLAINEALDNLPRVASDCRQLGIFAQGCGRLGEAKEWYKKSLAIIEALDDQPDIAGIYDDLGLVERIRGRLDEAEGWHEKSLAIVEAQDDQLRIAYCYLCLGKVELFRGRLDKAEGWYKKSLAIAEALDDQSGIAGIYYEIGVVAQQHGRWREAKSWYMKSLAIFEALGDQPNMALVYHLLGLATSLKQSRRAKDWLLKAQASYVALGDKASGDEVGVHLVQLKAARLRKRTALFWRKLRRTFTRFATRDKDTP